MKPVPGKKALVILMVLFSCIYTRNVNAQEVLFDFEIATVHSPLPITLTSGGITATFNGTGENYSIQWANTMGFTPPGFSGLCIYPSSVFLADLLIKFNQPLSDFAILYSAQELGCDDAETMRVTAQRSLFHQNQWFGFYPYASCNVDKIKIDWRQQHTTCLVLRTNLSPENLCVMTPAVKKPSKRNKPGEKTSHISSFNARLKKRLEQTKKELAIAEREYEENEYEEIEREYAVV